jgi:hypothetical protein
MRHDDTLFVEMLEMVDFAKMDGLRGKILHVCLGRCEGDHV